MVCITTASESSFLEVRTAVLSITEGRRPAQAALQAGLGPRGFPAVPAHHSFPSRLFSHSLKIPGASCVPSSGKHLSAPPRTGGTRPDRGPGSEGHPRGVCHPKALPGRRPKLLKDLKLEEKHNSLFHASMLRRLQKRQSPSALLRLCAGDTSLEK